MSTHWQPLVAVVNIGNKCALRNNQVHERSSPTLGSPIYPILVCRPSLDTYIYCHQRTLWCAIPPTLGNRADWQISLFPDVTPSIATKLRTWKQEPFEYDKGRCDGTAFQCETSNIGPASSYTDWDHARTLSNPCWSEMQIKKVMIKQRVSCWSRATTVITLSLLSVDLVILSVSGDLGEHSHRCWTLLSVQSLRTSCNHPY